MALESGNALMRANDYSLMTGKSDSFTSSLPLRREYEED